VDALMSSKTKEKLDKKHEELTARVQAQMEKHQERIGHLVSQNSTIPVTISEVRVFQASKTRTGFLERICRPLLEKGKEPISLLEAREEIDKVATQMNKLGA
jgi:outer membrane protein insertion porin family